MGQLPIRPEGRGAFLVLASGGVDSSTLLCLSAQQGLKPAALFLDYGQPAAKAEGEAVGKDLQQSECSLESCPIRRLSIRCRRNPWPQRFPVAHRIAGVSVQFRRSWAWNTRRNGLPRL